MGRVIGFVLLFIAVAGGVIVSRILNAAGYFNDVTPHFAGKCQSVEGVVGAEDIELDRATGVLFLSSQDRRPAADGSYKPGAIYLALVDKPDMQPVPLIENDDTFHPHGLSLFIDAADRKTLAVVNHTGKGDEVRLFDVTDTPDDAVKLTLRRAITHPLMHALNDVTLLSHEAFYATNDHGSETELGKFLETWLLLPRANVVYYDGNDARVAATGFNYANGINRSVDASEIYVAEATGRAMQTFRRNLTTGELAHIRTLDLNVGPDNLDVDSEGTIWIGAHPRLLDFLAHSEDPKKLSPSAVLKVTPAGDDTKVEEVYVNNGEQLSGSSVAVYSANRLIIGPVFDAKFLNCTLS